MESLTLDATGLAWLARLAGRSVWLPGFVGGRLEPWSLPRSTLGEVGGSNLLFNNYINSLNSEYMAKLLIESSHPLIQKSSKRRDFGVHRQMLDEIFILMGQQITFTLYVAHIEWANSI